ncbi:transcriptional regulator of the spore photoproduct lyase operon [Aureibacillus halotolerans]|uniref:Transcriptional regulator of the spore photoproduct lyase operon n=2 Tax=Aureibacillus halotolerans TaxID=1508390 RepID=A0A4V3D4J7_9BACI|nr:transcriptional regulator of the spore photoproduct lyase operon [Aureibacillus halotolerans]
MLSAGESVFVIYRNPHTQNVATIQEAQILQDPISHQPALFLYDHYYPLDMDYAMYSTYEEAEAAYEDYFYVDEYNASSLDGGHV